MSIATVMLALIWIAVTVYALLAGADFGAGIWDLTPGAAASRNLRRNSGAAR